MSTLQIDPVNYMDAISEDPDRRKDAQTKMGRVLERYGFGFWTNVPLDHRRVKLLYKGGREIMDRWDEVMERCPREQLGMVGPTGPEEEKHPDFPPDHKMYVAVDKEGRGWPSFIPGQVSTEIVFRDLYKVGVKTIEVLESHRGQPKGFLSSHLSDARPPLTHTSGRLNMYPANVGFSRPHEDTGIFASLLWRPGLMIQQGNEYVELVGAQDGDVVINIGASGSKFLTELFGLSTWHHVKEMPQDRISFVVFGHTNRDVCFPNSDVNVFDWCKDRFESRGGTEDRQAIKV